MNLDKCIGCHTCSVTCKQTWTNRAGVEYVWFNNVETRPGQGYPRRHEDQQTWRGGWTLNRRGRLTLKAGGRLRKLLGIFASPVQPELEDYYEPWTYDYETLVDAPLGNDFPVARLVQVCLQVTEQVWHPMHLSRFITMPIWAITRISTSRPGCAGGWWTRCRAGSRSGPGS
jgi:nitrate reductase beta subunit